MEQIFSTKDLKLASVLITLGFHYEPRRQGPVWYFSFPNADLNTLDETIDKYFQKGLLVDPRILFDNYEILKTRVKEGIG